MTVALESISKLALSFAADTGKALHAGTRQELMGRSAIIASLALAESSLTPCLEAGAWGR